jgi:hypothetical protein
MATCWFCKKEAESPDAAELVKMYSKVKRGDINNYLVVKARSVQFKTCEISIPRCKKCKDKNTREILTGFLVFLCCFGTAYLVISYGFSLSGWLSYAMIVGLGGALVIASMVLIGVLSPSERSVRPTDYYDNYPPLLDLVRQGWTIGGRPPRDF